MKMKQALAALVTTSLVATPVVTQAASVPAARTAAPVGEAENIQGGWLVPAFAILAVLLGIWIVVDGGDDDLPTSP